MARKISEKHFEQNKGIFTLKEYVYFILNVFTLGQLLHQNNSEVSLDLIGRQLVFRIETSLYSSCMVVLYIYIYFFF